MSVISLPTSVVMELSAIVKICKYRRFHEGQHFIPMPMGCMVHPGVIWIVSLESVLVFPTIDDQKIIYLCLFTFNFSWSMLVLFFNVL